MIDDATTETGQRLEFDKKAYATTAEALRAYRQVFTEDLSELDGFGVNAEAFFTFGRHFDRSTLPNAEDWLESAESPAGVRTERQMERDALARKLDVPHQKAA